VVPVPFVSWTPGEARDTLGKVGNEPIIKVQGIQIYPTTGQLDMAIIQTTAADGWACRRLVELLVAAPRHVAPDSVYAPGSRPRSRGRGRRSDGDRPGRRRGAALRADDQPVTEMPVIYSVTVGGPSHKLPLPGDLVIAVDGVPTPDEDLSAA
jgi:PDZ domain-containing protein